MSVTEEQSKKEMPKRDFVSFVIDASQENATLGERFIGELNREGVTANELHQVLKDWGYADVQLEEVNKLLTVFKSSERARGAVIETGY